MGNKVQKTQQTQQTRILALDVHPRSFGYVVVEGPKKLLDWGVRRSYQRTKSHPEVLARGRLRPLLKIWKPGVVVTRVGDRRNKDVQSLLRHMKKESGATSFLRITGTRDYYLEPRQVPACCRDGVAISRRRLEIATETQARGQ